MNQFSLKLRKKMESLLPLKFKTFTTILDYFPFLICCEITLFCSFLVIDFKCGCISEDKTVDFVNKHPHGQF